MAITIIKQSQFLIPSLTARTATVSATGNEALFTSAGHPFANGDLLYIHGNLSAYNGQWRATGVTASTFRIIRNGGLTNQRFVNSGSVTYYGKEGENLWSSVHLPMVYKFTSDKWPVNTVDTARTVTSFSTSNGYTRVNLSGDIKASGSADALEQVKISGTATLDGIYKILSWSSDVSFVIDLSYSATNSFTGGTIQYYYGNYHGILRVYAGLPIGHYWRDQKPYELVATINITFDSDNTSAVNINEFVKKKINILENNLLLDTLPNNIDAFCYTYVEWAESYDDANQYGTNDLNVSEYIGPFTSITPVKAINAKLPFKTVSSGVMNGYVYGSSASAKIKFLTAFSRPTLFVNNYFDLSFISDDGEMLGYYILRRVKDSGGATLHDFVDAIPDRDQGVYRYSIAQSSFLETTIEVTLFNSTYGREVQLSDTLVIDVDSTCSPQDYYVTWLNYLGGYDYWNFKGETSYGTSILESKTQEKNIYPLWPDSYGEFADSIEKQTVRRTKDTVVLNSQYIDNEYGKFDAFLNIIESPLVQKLTSIYDKRTILLGNSSQNRKVDNQKLLMLTVEARYTDENPSQSL